jgi:hypothetical protein
MLIFSKATAFDTKPENIRRTALYAMSYWLVFSVEPEPNDTASDFIYQYFCSEISMDNVLLIQVTIADLEEGGEAALRPVFCPNFKKLMV